MVRGMESRKPAEDVHVLACAECARVRTVTARGWTAHRIEDPELDEPPALAFLCPVCTRRELRGER